MTRTTVRQVATAVYVVALLVAVLLLDDAVAVVAAVGGVLLALTYVLSARLPGPVGGRQRDRARTRGRSVS